MFIRALAVMLVIAVGVRLIFVLLIPIAGYLAVAMIVCAACWTVCWWRNRW